MNPFQNTVSDAIKEVKKILDILRKSKSLHLKKIEEELIKAIGSTWVNNRRRLLIIKFNDIAIFEINENYNVLLDYLNKKTLRSKYISLTKGIQKKLVSFESQNRVKLSDIDSAIEKQVFPDLSKFILDVDYLQLLEKRWNEIVICVDNELRISSLVLIGSLLEAIFFF